MENLWYRVQNHPPIQQCRLKNWTNWVAPGHIPDAQLTFEGPPDGIGSSYRWVGNQEVGEGRLMITESHPSDRIQMDLEFLQPFQSSNLVIFGMFLNGVLNRLDTI